MEYQKQMARIPIIPDDINGRRFHKEHEIVMDFEKDDLYIKKDGDYLNLTGRIKDEVQEIHDGSAIIHIVTEDTLPSIQDRKENHWYVVITMAKDRNTGQSIDLIDCIYYGLINIYDENKEYLLVGQNITIGEDTVKFEILEGYVPCFYVPIVYSAEFRKHGSQEIISFDIVDRLYAINTFYGSYAAYDVYVLNLSEPGEHFVDLILRGMDMVTVDFQSSVDPEQIGEITLPDPMKVRKGFSIGEIPNPIYDNPQYTFIGWGTDKFGNSLIDPSMYKPETDSTLYAKFEYHDQSEEIDNNSAQSQGDINNG